MVSKSLAIVMASFIEVMEQVAQTSMVSAVTFKTEA
jgi:hypothetical protein